VSKKKTLSKKTALRKMKTLSKRQPYSKLLPVGRTEPPECNPALCMQSTACNCTLEGIWVGNAVSLEVVLT
jgi:hypothetical protein